MNKIYNDSQKKYQHELYEWYKAHQICVKCKQETAVKGKTKCISCAEKESARGRKRYEALKKEYCTERKYNAYCRAKRLYDLRIAFGVCVKCGKRNAIQGHIMCNECRTKHNGRQEIKRREKGIYPRDSYSGLCVMCNKNAPLKGKKLCCNCYEISLQNLAKAALKRSTDKHIWRVDDAARIESVLSSK